MKILATLFITALLSTIVDGQVLPFPNTLYPIPQSQGGTGVSAGPLPFAGFQDTTSGHTSAPTAFDASGNLVPITVSTGLTYNTSTKTLSATGGGTVTSITAGNGLSGGTITTSGTIAVQSTTGSTSISSTGTTTLSATGPVNSNALTFGAGSGAYTSSVVLSDSAVFAGQVYEVYCSLPASTNPTINIYDASTGGTLLATITSNGTAGATTLQFVNSGTAWSIYKKGALLQFQNLADLPSASTARTNLGVPGIATTNNFTADQTITNTVGPQLTLAYNGSNYDTFNVGSTGALSIVTNPTAQIQLIGANGNGINITPQFNTLTLVGMTISNNVSYAGFDGQNLYLGTNSSIRFTNSTTYGSTVDTQITRPSANTLSVDTTSAGNGLGSIKAANFIGGVTMTANTTATITFNTSGNSETIYDSSASTLTTATITLPSTSAAGQLLTYTSNGIITSLTITGGTQDVGPTLPTTLAANTVLQFQEDNTTGHYVRVK